MVSLFAVEPNETVEMQRLATIYNPYSKVKPLHCYIVPILVLTIAVCVACQR